MWRKQIRCTNICLRGSRKHRLIVIYWTLSARELRDRTRFFECAKRCPFIISIHVHAWYTSLRGKEGAQLDRGVERVGAQRLVGNKSGRWRRKALSGARVRKRKRQWYIVRPGTLAVHASHPFLIWRTRETGPLRLHAAHSLNIARDVSLPAAIPSHFGFVTFRLPVCPLWSTRPTIRELSKFIGIVHSRRSIDQFEFFFSEDLNF